MSFFLSYSSFSDIANPPSEKKTPDLAVEQRLASEISACYRLLSEEPSEQTETSVAAARIPFHTLGNQRDLELRAAAVNAEIINAADPETLDNSCK